LRSKGDDRTNIEKKSTKAGKQKKTGREKGTRGKSGTECVNKRNVVSRKHAHAKRAREGPRKKNFRNRRKQNGGDSPHSPKFKNTDMALGVKKNGTWD